MAWVAAADFSFSEGRYVMRWPDGATMPCLINIIDGKAYVTISIMGVSFYADAVKNGFQVEVEDPPAPEDPDQEHQIEDDPPPVDSPFAPVGPLPVGPGEPLPGPPLAPDQEITPVAK